MKRREFLISTLAFSAAVPSYGSARAISGDCPIETGAKIDRLATGFVFLEGPVCAPDGSIFLCEFRKDKIYVLSPGGETRLFMEDSGGISGLFYDPQGCLIGAGSHARALFELAADSSKTMIADSHGGRRFNAPNDIWISPSGNIYFSDPNWNNRPTETGGGAVYCLSADRKRLFPALTEFDRPNGVVGDPARNRLYVINRDEFTTYFFPILSDGSLGEKVRFAGAGRDGMTVDRAGNVYVIDEELMIFDKDGRPAGIVAVPERPANACFAGEDRQTLIITASTSVYAVRTTVPGY